ncbi:hypothetical protein EV193_11627 [Herbihabitans rhizosphaerae]|uniref:Excreted virulence factor EspC (Type VII ESX diderm) n=1 Tax=Herbihabitans rhizosphaerae TaxID=1872711 RepID=A0A4Q7KC02_9PSEU|nr:hypothetical protein [Herbihabitans rhizosphaerae]RZS30507.1 hypothetical protein EV193_11627 [Herbihabitans rhizosphaerae]
MAEGYHADGGRLAATGKLVGDFSRVATATRERTAAADVPADAFGVIGAGLYNDYTATRDDLTRLLDKLAGSVGSLGDALAVTGVEYGRTEDEHTAKYTSIGRDLDRVAENMRSSYGGWEPGKSWGEGGYAKAAGGALPGPAGPFAKLVYHGKDAASADGTAFDVAAVTGDAVSLGYSCTSTAATIIADPLGWLLSQGINFAMTAIPPLKDLINVVSGNGDVLAAAAKEYGGVATDLDTMGRDLVDTCRKGVPEWDGQAAEAAEQRVARFATGTGGIAGKAGNVGQLLQMYSIVMKLVEDFIKGILSDLAEWMALTWIPALVAGPFTLGGSIAAAASATVIKATTAIRRALEKVTVLKKLIDKVRKILGRLKEALKRGGEKFTSEAGKGGQAATKAQQALHDRMKKDLATPEADKPSQVAQSLETAGTMLKDASVNSAKKMTGLDKTKIPGAAADGGTAEVYDPGKITSKLAGYGKDAHNATKYGTPGEERSSEQIERDLDT